MGDIEIKDTGEINKSGKLLTVNIEQEDFAKMIMNFMGKKESLEYINTKRKFLLNIKDLTNLHYSLIQKIEKEQFTQVKNLSITVEFDDLTAHTFNSIEKLSFI